MKNSIKKVAKAVLFRKGQKIATIEEAQYFTALMREVEGF